MRGRAFGFIAILCATWVTARMGFALLADWHKQATPHNQVSAGAISPPVTPIGQGRLSGNVSAKTGYAPISGRILALAPTHGEPMGVRPNSRMYALVNNAFDSTPDNDAPNHLPSNTPTPVLFKLPKKPRSVPPIEIYAYSFWRRGDAAQAALGNGQYGGSQSALLMTIPLLRHRRERSVSRFAIIGRASVSHDDLRAREWSAGLRWRPSTTFPAHLSLEQRFRPDRPDAVAAFVSGGHDGALLPLGFAFDGYGQAGFVTGKSGGGFADVQLHALKPLIIRQHATLAAGVGAWAGGQSDVMRVDIGPSIRADLLAGSTPLRLDASWRFRIGGRAGPGNGPAVTLSTSF